MTTTTIHIVTAANNHDCCYPVRGFPTKELAEAFAAECTAYDRTAPRPYGEPGTPERAATDAWKAAHPAAPYIHFDRYEASELPFVTPVDPGAYLVQNGDAQIPLLDRAQAERLAAEHGDGTVTALYAGQPPTTNAIELANWCLEHAPKFERVINALAMKGPRPFDWLPNLFVVTKMASLAKRTIGDKWRDVVTGDRHTDAKANDIIERDGYKFTGAVLQHADGRRAIVELGAVRWLDNGEMWELMHPRTNAEQRDEGMAFFAWMQEKRDAQTGPAIWSAACEWQRKQPRAEE